MKQLSLILSLLFLVSFAFAQNTATTTQTGNGNDAFIDQIGDEHSAIVNQFGTNYADVKQNSGNNNSATVNQGILGAPVSNNHVPAYSGDHEWGAWVEQKGSDNIAEIDQQGNSGSASIYQDGNTNQTFQEINTFASGATSTTRKGLDINQIGDQNWANQKTVASFGSYGIKKMYVDQIGDNNASDQFSQGGMASTMEVRQEGNNNDFNVDVSATGKSSPLDMPFAHKPTGDFAQYQNGRYSTANTDILGDNNHTAQYQEYTVWSTSGANYAEIDIIGNENNVAQGQIGESNTTTVNVIGDLNVSSMAQIGELNNAAITQTGNGNVASIMQSN